MHDCVKEINALPNVKIRLPYSNEMLFMLFSFHYVIIIYVNFQGAHSIL